MEHTGSEEKEGKEEQRPRFEEPSEDASDEARQLRFETWAQESHDVLQGSFDTLKFCRDFMAKDVITTLRDGQERLLAMVGDYPSTERGAANQSQLGMEGAEFGEFCSRAMTKFCNFDFKKLHAAEIGVLRNSFQASDPSKYPETDTMLQMSFDVLGCVDNVVEMIANGEIGPPPQLDQATIMAILRQALGGGEIDLSSLQIGESKESAAVEEDSKAAAGEATQEAPEASEQPAGDEPTEEGSGSA